MISVNYDIYAEYDIDAKYDVDAKYNADYDIDAQSRRQNGRKRQGQRSGWRLGVWHAGYTIEGGESCKKPMWKMHERVRHRQ